MNAPGVWVCDRRACPPITCMERCPLAVPAACGGHAPVPAVVVPELAAEGGPDGGRCPGHRIREAFGDRRWLVVTPGAGQAGGPGGCQRA